MYCGDHEHYDFMGRVFELFAHVNALQRDMCPSMTKFEGEIIAMTLDLLHADAITDGDAGRARHVGRQRQHPARGARVPRVRAADARHRPPELREARDRAPRVRQGVPPARRRAAARADRSRRPRWSTSTRWRSSSTTNTIAIDRLGLQLRLRHDRPDRRALRPRARARRRPARRRLPRRLHPAVGPGARLRHPGLRLPRPGRHDRSRPTRTSTATASRARRCSRSATRRCATASTSS